MYVGIEGRKIRGKATVKVPGVQKQSAGELTSRVSSMAVQLDHRRNNPLFNSDFLNCQEYDKF